MSRKKVFFLSLFFPPLFGKNERERERRKERERKKEGKKERENERERKKERKKERKTKERSLVFFSLFDSNYREKEENISRLHDHKKLRTLDSMKP